MLGKGGGGGRGGGKEDRRRMGVGGGLLVGFSHFNSLGRFSNENNNNNVCVV